jgi:hypothetical protein
MRGHLHCKCVSAFLESQAGNLLRSSLAHWQSAVAHRRSAHAATALASAASNAASRARALCAWREIVRTRSNFRARDAELAAVLLRSTYSPKNCRCLPQHVVPPPTRQPLPPLASCAVAICQALSASRINSLRSHFQHSRSLMQSASVCRHLRFVATDVTVAWAAQQRRISMELSQQTTTARRQPPALTWGSHRGTLSRRLQQLLSHTLSVRSSSSGSESCSALSNLTAHCTPHCPLIVCPPVHTQGQLSAASMGSAGAELPSATTAPAAHCNVPVAASSMQHVIQRDTLKVCPLHSSEEWCPSVPCPVSHYSLNIQKPSRAENAHGSTIPHDTAGAAEKLAAMHKEPSYLSASLLGVPVQRDQALWQPRAGPCGSQELCCLLPEISACGTNPRKTTWERTAPEKMPRVRYLRQAHSCSALPLVRTEAAHSATRVRFLSIPPSRRRACVDFLPPEETSHAADWSMEQASKWGPLEQEHRTCAIPSHRRHTIASAARQRNPVARRPSPPFLWEALASVRGQSCPSGGHAPHRTAENLDNVTAKRPCLLSPYLGSPSNVRARPRCLRSSVYCRDSSIAQPSVDEQTSCPANRLPMPCEPHTSPTSCSSSSCSDVHKRHTRNRSLGNNIHDRLPFRKLPSREWLSALGTLHFHGRSQASVATNHGHLQHLRHCHSEEPLPRKRCSADVHCSRCQHLLHCPSHTRHTPFCGNVYDAHIHGSHCNARARECVCPRHLGQTSRTTPPTPKAQMRDRDITCMMGRVVPQPSTSMSSSSICSHKDASLCHGRPPLPPNEVSGLSDCTSSNVDTLPEPFRLHTPEKRSFSRRSMRRLRHREALASAAADILAAAKADHEKCARAARRARRRLESEQQKLDQLNREGLAAAAAEMALLAAEAYKDAQQVRHAFTKVAFLYSVRSG